MRVVLLADGRIDRDPRGRALGWSLRHVGHEVVSVDAAGEAGWADTAIGVPRRVPSGPGKLRAVARRLQPPSMIESLHRRRLATAASGIEPDLVYPMSPDLIAVADRAVGAGAVMRQPGWAPPRRDLVTMAPGMERFSTSPAGPGLGYHRALDLSPGTTPQPGRHRGIRIALVHRITPTSPARYLTAALQRAGVEVVSPGHRFDFDDAPAVDAVVVVESPYPPAELTGTRPDVPVLFWIHHGEHHLGANLRLVDRLRPDAVLLAHSWHLAHRFPVPVHRFPFGVPTDLFPDPLPEWTERPHVVAMVGVGMRRSGSRYDVRRSLVTRLGQEFGPRAVFPERVPPEELAAIYASSRVVINDGGRRHHPITMRVFEAVGAAALLLTEDLPGTDLVFSPTDHYRTLNAEAVVSQVSGLASDPEAGKTAADAHRHALDHHTYDHRVDQLMEVVSATKPAGWHGRTRPESSLARLIDDDIEVDILAATAADLRQQLPDRVVWDIDQVADRLAAGGRIDASAFTQVHPRLDEVVAGTRQYVYAEPPAAASVAEAVERHHPGGTIEFRDGYLRADTGTTERYRYAGQEAP